ncbi:uncharacterized protein SPSK_08082 [Sporothrix schenckii 1099-18]|uniref:Uncharacterized protein n=1 Tax=Sporothrix schenckii 1099-18 TaxID=1397361 RepID=A0A0F2MHV1_SPOSC|nr:uncharacterized protein SPSK_08082 [Sporothrix schenckii 1099-18]KJR87751.1 hypothetical protein SPSK_08082 [Sporothrix schenckii 1099-18]
MIRRTQTPLSLVYDEKEAHGSFVGAGSTGRVELVHGGKPVRKVVTPALKGHSVYLVDEMRRDIEIDKHLPRDSRRTLHMPNSIGHGDLAYIETSSAIMLRPQVCGQGTVNTDGPTGNAIVPHRLPVPNEHLV